MMKIQFGRSISRNMRMEKECYCEHGNEPSDFIRDKTFLNRILTTINLFELLRI
jgi:hypothetical protein